MSGPESHQEQTDQAMMSDLEKFRDRVIVPGTLRDAPIGKQFRVKYPYPESSEGGKRPADFNELKAHAFRRSPVMSIVAHNQDYLGAALYEVIDPTSISKLVTTDGKIPASYRSHPDAKNMKQSSVPIGELVVVQRKTRLALFSRAEKEPVLFAFFKR